MPSAHVGLNVGERVGEGVGSDIGLSNKVSLLSNLKTKCNVYCCRRISRTRLTNHQICNVMNNLKEILQFE